MPSLDDTRFVNAVLDLVIPPEDPHPGAGALDMASALKKQLAPMPQVAPLLEAGFDAVREAADPPTQEALAQVVAAQPGFMPTLQMFLYVAYYQHPEVLRSHGLTGRPPFPEGREIAATDESLLAKLRRKT